MDPTTTTSGLEGVVVAETRLSEVDGERGRLVVAGHDIERLAGRVTFEDVAALLWAGALPDADGREAQRRALAGGRVAAFERLAATRRRDRPPRRHGRAACRDGPPVRAGRLRRARGPDLGDRGMLDAIGSPQDAAAWIDAELAGGRRIVGMGHRIYRVRDPRAAVLERAIARLEPRALSYPSARHNSRLKTLKRRRVLPAVTAGDRRHPRAAQQWGRSPPPRSSKSWQHLTSLIRSVRNSRCAAASSTARRRGSSSGDCLATISLRPRTGNCYRSAPSR